jgi:hypothetical protein
MRRGISALLFLSIALSLLGGLHLYLATRLVLDPGWAEPWRTGGLAILAALGALLVVGPIAERTLRNGLARGLSIGAWSWLGLGFLLVVTQGALDLLGWIAGSTAQAAGGDELALTTARIRAGASVSLVLLAGGIGMRQALRGPRTVEREVRLERWPQALDGFRLVQLSDVHLGAILRREFARELARRVRELRPDLIAVTGDLADGSAEHLGEEAAPLAELEAPCGVYFVTGNHDHYSGADGWVCAVESLGMRALRNRRVTIERAGSSFELAGVDDHRGGFEGSSEDLLRALDGRDPGRALVLLAHDPATFRAAAAAGVDLQLSGHTHGGQIWPFRYLVRLTTRYVAGAYREGDAQLYVSRGTGFWGPPMRLGSPAEITVHVLRRG